jgi:hypothetical protein
MGSQCMCVCMCVCLVLCVLDPVGSLRLLQEESVGGI